jgi:hypothetical protein
MEADERKRGSSVGLLVVGVLVLGGVGTGGYLMTRDDAEATAGADDDDDAPDDPAEVAASGETKDCPTLKALAGAWKFHTEVAASRVLSSSGLNGFYELQVDLDGCHATVSVTKTGYTGRSYGAEDRPSGTAELVAGTGPWAFGWMSTFQLRTPDEEGADLEFLFVADGERLSGVYRQRGERWTKTGLTGFLQGSRDGEIPSDPSLGEQPCTVRCAVTCDVSHRDERLMPDALAGCMSACEPSGTEIPQCGDAKELPAAHALKMTGPRKVKDVCDGLGGCVKKITVGKDRAPWLAARRFDAQFEGARFIAPKKKDKRPRLAVKTAKGWFVSDPLVGATHKGGLELARLYSRHLAEGEGRRHLFGLVASQIRGERLEAYFQCRVDGGVPHCVQIPKTRSMFVSPLPGGAISVGPAPEGEAVEGAPPPGVYTW